MMYSELRAARSRLAAQAPVVEAAAALADWEFANCIVTPPCGNCAPCNFQRALRKSRAGGS